MGRTPVHAIQVTHRQGEAARIAYAVFLFGHCQPVLAQFIVSLKEWAGDAASQGVDSLAKRFDIVLRTLCLLVQDLRFGDDEIHFLEFEQLFNLGSHRPLVSPAPSLTVVLWVR